MAEHLEEARTADEGANPSGPLQRLGERAQALGLKVEHDVEPDDESPTLRVFYPEGRDTRPIEYDERVADRLEHFDLGSVRFIPNVYGLIDTKAGSMEARVRTRGLVLRSLPGVETLVQGDVEEELAEDEAQAAPPSMWRIVVEKSGVRLELSPASDWYLAVTGIADYVLGHTTVKLSGVKHATSEEALSTLRVLTDALFFDLDVRYGANVSLQERSAPLLRPRSSRVASPPEFPTSKYLGQPIALYRYGRSSLGLPLLSFLAFYQVLEFFFPIFNQQDVTRRVQQALRSPRFDPSDDVSVLRLIETIRPSLRFGVSENEQLRTVIRRCLDDATLREFVTSSTQVRDHFCRKQSISGLSALNLQASSADLRDQIADRIYDIRCRIVHTKSDGGEGGVELLLPAGREARSLGPDIALVRLAAQESIIAGASRLDPHQP